MKLLNLIISIVLVTCVQVSVLAQKAEVRISLDEAFFDSALEAVFQKGAPLEFSLAQGGDGSAEGVFVTAAYRERSECAETIKVVREINGVRTAVRFRDGKIWAPLAFTGNYDPPFLGCVPFSGWAECVIDLELNQNSNRLVARVRVLKVNLSGTGGVGGTVVARLVQSSIDKRINPVDLLELAKLNFALPIKGASALQMKAVGIRHELQNGSIDVVISYEFV